MLIRYFGAAQAAAGVAEERLELGRASLGDVLSEVRARHDGPGGPSMAQVLSRSSFLLNELSLRDHDKVLGPEDVLDVLPPFAGG